MNSCRFTYLFFLESKDVKLRRMLQGLAYPKQPSSTTQTLEDVDAKGIDDNQGEEKQHRDTATTREKRNDIETSMTTREKRNHHGHQPQSRTSAFSRPKKVSFSSSSALRIVSLVVADVPGCRRYRHCPCVR